LTDVIGFNMDIQDFIKKRPYLYHLTDRSNLPLILKAKELWSTTAIVTSFLPKKDAYTFLREKREKHTTIFDGKLNYKIRDQKPILMTVLERSLSEGNAGDFIELLNKRVFWWPTLSRLNRHYNTYANEKPVILRVKTDEIFEINDNIEFCHLNSGATRCHPKYQGNAPTRGKNSFLSIENYNKDIASVAEVTFVGTCKLPQNVWVGSQPDGKWNVAE
jgi:hypothetical protein